MKSKILKFIVLLAVLAVIVTAGGCAVAEVKIGRDGTGTATVTVTKEGRSEEEVRASLDEVFDGVGFISGDVYRLKLKSLKDAGDTFVATVKFKRIQYTKGVGDFNYMKAADFYRDNNKLPLLRRWANGRWNPFHTYKDEVIVFDNGTIADPTVSFRPKYAETGESVDLDDLDGEDGIIANAGNRDRVFTFFMAGLEGLESVTFRFDGKIKIYGGKNVELIDDSTIRVTPVEMKAKVSSSSVTGEARTENVFLGYVLIKTNVSPLLICLAVAGGLIIAGGVAYGIISGFFKRMVKGRRFRLFKNNWDLYLMLAPAFILLAVFSYTPMFGVVLAFKDYRVADGIFGSEWTGLGGFRHFWELFTTPASSFGMLARNTVILALLKFVFGFVCAIGLAVLFNYLKNATFKKTVQTISYFPYFISWVVISGIAYLFLAKDGGILNKIIAFFGGQPVQWYAEPQYWRTILTFTSVWKTVGYSTIVYLAAITAIDPSLYEAAMIDGGGRWKQFVHITLPGLFPVIGLQMVFSLGNLVRDDFDQIYTMVGGANAALSSTTEVIGTVVYKAISNASSYSSAAAMGLLQGAVALIIVLLSNRLVKRMGMSGAF